MRTADVSRMIVRRTWIEYPTWISDESFTACIRRFRWDHWVLVQGPETPREHYDLEDWVLRTPEGTLIKLDAKKLRAAQREADGVIIRHRALQRGVENAFDGVTVIG